MGTLFCNEPDSKYFWRCGPSCLCYNYSTLPLRCESSHGQDEMMGYGCIATKLAFTETGGGPDLVHGE